MSTRPVFCGILVSLAVALGCGKKPEPPAPDAPNVVIAPGDPPPKNLPPEPEVAPMPRLRVPAAIKWVPGTKEEQAALITHIPEPIRKLYGPDPFTCFNDLGGKAFAWEYTGGPVRLWLEFEEKGQSTVPARYPEREDWLIPGETGRIIFWARRGVSDKINSVLKRAGKPEGDTSAVELGVTITSSAGGISAAVGYTNPLWYGWRGAIFDRDRPVQEVPLPGYEPTEVFSLTAEEANPAEGKNPRRAKLVLKIQRIKPQ
jgi:hypothetical protein